MGCGASSVPAAKEDVKSKSLPEAQSQKSKDESKKGAKTTNANNTEKPKDEIKSQGMGIGAVSASSVQPPTEAMSADVSISNVKPEAQTQTTQTESALGSGQAFTSKASTSKYPLEERAVHPMLLMKIAETEVTINGSTQKLGELSIYDVVDHFVKPYTQQTGRSLIEDILEEKVTLPGMKGVMCTSLPQGWRGKPGWSWLNGKSQPLIGTTTFYISYAWSTKFYDLVELIVFQHYRHQASGANMIAATTLPYFPMFYWLDMFAMTTHFTGDLRAHPDGPINAAVKASRAVLLMLGPLSTSPALLRMWCLYEAMLALHCDVGLELLLPADTLSGSQSVLDLEKAFLETVVNQLDVRNAEVRSEDHRSFILQAIEDFKSVDAFNAHMRNLLPSRLVESLFVLSLMTGNAEKAQKLFDTGARITANTLGLAHCKMEDLTTVNILCSGIKTSRSLRRLNLTGNPLTIPDIRSLASSLDYGSRLTHLDLSCVTLGDEGAEAIGKALAASKSMVSLILYKVGMTATGLSALADGLRDNSTLQTLILAMNLGLAKAVLAFAQLGDVMGRHSTLAEIDLSSCGLIDETLDVLATGLAFSKSLTSLDLGSNEVGGDGVVALVSALSKVSTLRRLSLQHNMLSPEALKAVADMVAKHKGLTDLDLIRTGLDDDTIKPLIEALSDFCAPALEILSLNQCMIGDSGAIALAAKFAIHPRLKILRLVRCGVEETGALALAEAAGKKGGSCEVSLAVNNSIPKSTWPQLVEISGGRIIA